METMSPIEFAYWRAIYRREPFGYDIDNYRMGTIAAAATNASRTRKRDMVSPSVFYPPSPKQKPSLTPRQQEQLKKRRNVKPRS